MKGESSDVSLSFAKWLMVKFQGVKMLFLGGEFTVTMMNPEIRIKSGRGQSICHNHVTHLDKMQFSVHMSRIVRCNFALEKSSTVSIYTFQ